MSFAEVKVSPDAIELRYVYWKSGGLAGRDDSFKSGVARFTIDEFNPVLLDMSGLVAMSSFWRFRCAIFLVWGVELMFWGFLVGGKRNKECSVGCCGERAAYTRSRASRESGHLSSRSQPKTTILLSNLIANFIIAKYV